MKARGGARAYHFCRVTDTVTGPAFGGSCAAVASAGDCIRGTLRARRNAAPLDEAALLRECARPECTHVCLDRSRGHRREWCAMRTSGNQVTAAAYQVRQHATQT
ncbi:CGNR zinc finger domain-containing protein [Streptomyces sp. Ncost-T10-10d]|uniref:CGNR zinc finger domain-containing protein n=1 Tax=Streptomyces sp. Ncost-T10-10d TaxID=1839774 RepID=UPI0035219E5D